MKESLLHIDTASQASVHVEEQEDKEKCTIVHCRIFCTSQSLVRIWPEVCLMEDTGRDCRLVHAIGIAIYPQWTVAEVQNNYFSFTLVFEGLSDSCKEFLLYEKIPEPGGFVSEVVPRNSTDVYEVELEAL